MREFVLKEKRLPIKKRKERAEGNLCKVNRVGRRGVGRQNE